MKPSNIKKNLQKRLRNIVEAAIYNRGLNYFNSGHVQSVSVSKQRREFLIKGKVRGTKNYKSELIFDPKKDGFSDLDCNCPYGAYCKHSVALGLEFISRYSEFLKTHSNYSEEELVDYLNGKEKPKSVIKKNVNDKYASGCDYDIKDDYDKKNDSEEDEEWGGEWETEWGEEYYDNYQS